MLTVFFVHAETLQLRSCAENSSGAEGFFLGEGSLYSFRARRARASERWLKVFWGGDGEVCFGRCFALFLAFNATEQQQ